MTYSHVKSGRIRRYLMSESSTSLDVAGKFIDKAEEAYDQDHTDMSISFETLKAREEALIAAKEALGNRDSQGVRRALRDFWSN